MPNQFLDLGRVSTCVGMKGEGCDGRCGLGEKKVRGSDLASPGPRPVLPGSWECVVGGAASRSRADHFFLGVGVASL